MHLSCTFDASLTAMFMPLLSGKSIIIGSKHGVEVFEDSNLQKYAPYDFLKITPAHLELLQPVIRDGEGALLTERLVIGGEALRLSHFSYYIDKGIDVEIINEYGPTEATVGCITYSFWTLKDQEKIKNEISIGKPIDNAQIYILGKNNELVPAGIDGEICVGGVGVARGYLNRDELTAEKFIKNPFQKEEGARIYKTGDLGRWLVDGNIEYAGRKDDQVKIRGYRIELGEIESNVLQSGMVSQAMVVAREDKEGNKKLTGYVVPTPELVKAKEKELYSVQVATWKELYETEYGQTEGDESVDPEFNIIGWNDSFTGMANPAEQMQEWLQDIVEVIMAEDPGYVLEIGCGTGLIYYQLAGKVKKYIGADLSRSSINQITQRISKGHRNYGPTELMVAPAHEVSLREDEQVDTIILNSMVQYFPGEDYMNSVIEKSISLLKGEGRIIIGDVRDYRLLKLFKARLNLKKLQDKASIKEFKWMLDQEVLKEEELCFSPDYFYNLQSLYPNITNVEIQWKHASYITELTLYRYNVVIHVGIEKEFIEPEWESWKGKNQKNNIIEKLEQEEVKTLALKGVPNPRLWREKLIDNALNNKSVFTIGDIITEKQDEESEEINSLLVTIETSKNYKYRLLVNEDPLKMNVFIEHKCSSGFVKQNYTEKDAISKGWNTNIPLFTDIGFLLQKDIKHFLQQRLPEYMIPLELISLDHLPLTINGKIDRIFLNQREDKAATNKLNYQPARTETEQMLVTIWEKLLNADRIGIYDNFFDLGGHSLLATRTISAIRKELDIEVAIKDLFIYPTIAKLSKYLQGQARGSALPAIEVQERPERIPLSFSQERLWFIDQLEGSVQYHIPQVLRLRGNLNKGTIKDALQTIVNRHEVLRTVIVEEEGHPYQQVKEKDGWELGIVDGREYRENVKGLQQCIYGLIKKPFDFSKDYMLRADLIEVEEQEHVLVATLHHIASDGWSTSVLVRELAEVYRSYVEGREAQLAILPVQYADYAIWQRKYLQGEVWEKKIGYWKEKLAGAMALQLPTDYVRPAVQSTRGARENFSIDKEVSEGLQLLNRKEGTTMFMVLLSVVKVLLYRYSGQQDITVGTAIAGRQQQEVEGLIGFFVNTLALRDEVIGAASFRSLLQSVKVTTLEAYGHQEVPFERVVETVVKERDLSSSPLFQVMFVFQNTPEIPRLELGEAALSRETFLQSTSKFDLSFNITETSEGLRGSIQYCTALYKKPTIERMIGHFTELLTSTVKLPGEKISKLQMLTAAEEDQLLKAFNNTASGYPKDKTITGLFEEQATKTPQSIALVYEEEELTYRELNERSNRLARYLQKKGVKEETLVPICIERGIGMMVGILGILKSGGAYVPIDPEYPQDRISYMLEDTAVGVIVSSKASKEKLPAKAGAEIILIDGDWDEISKEATPNLSIGIAPNSLAYVIYTSGSTGKPKGVLIEHRNVVRLFLTDKPLFDFSEKDVWTMFHSFCFDFSVWEMYGALFYGGRLVIVPANATKDTILFAELLLKEKVTILNQTPSAFYVLQDVLVPKTNQVDIRYVIFGGEALNPAKVRPWKKLYKNSRIINMYGITETTVHVTYQEIGWEQIENGNSIIGKTIPTLYAYVLDNSQNLLPIGIAGELCVGGKGLARGYLNRDDLTAQKFITNPFVHEPDARMYRSGDVGRWMPDGTIEYLGRMDDQVKIRGYRIELGEIETVALQSGLVNQVMVLARSNNAEGKRLVGYVVCENKLDRQSLTGFLHTKLPDYMVPVSWVQLDQFPLTSNGKVNKKALPDPGAAQLIANEYVVPRNELESGLAEIWKELLQVDRVGVYDNFFELGGHSLLVIILVSAIRKKLKIELAINDIFIYPTIADFAENFIEKIKNPSSQSANIKYLVPLKTGGNKVPLYIVCGEGGTALRFKPFAELLDPDQPVYALQLPVDTNELKNIPGSIEEISKLFIDEILVNNPSGPYALAGHCLGGFIAFEIARQLKEIGKKVHLLSMFDTVISKPRRKRIPSLKNLYLVPLKIKKSTLKILFKINFESFLFRKHTKHAIGYKLNSLKFLLYKIRNRKKLKSGDLEYMGLDAFKKQFAYSDASKNYELSQYNDEIVLFYAKERYYFMDVDKKVTFKKLYLTDETKNMWNRYSNEIVIHEVEGEHSTMFEPANSNEFARLLQTYLNTNS
ncbi:MAG: amino acid adenylation domain-containing protein [Ginsengibacter sp.]